MTLDKIALILVIVLATVWAMAMLAGLVASLPYGLPVLLLFAIGGYLIYRVLRDRLDNAEDDYYEKNIKQ
jgi:peptidoglycan/LPS O-acetylase OafA/YrhL